MKRLKYALLASSLTTCCLYIAPATAADIRLSGFFNAIGSKHDAKDMQYLEAVDDVWGFDSTGLGINLSSKIDDNISVAAQLFANEGEVVFDWGFATYQFDDSSAIKFGKLKYAGNLYSETADVGFIYPWVRAPEAIYSESSGIFFETYEGAAYKFTGGEDTEFAVEVYYGATDGDNSGNIISSRDQMYGLVATAENEMGKLLFSYNSSVHSSLNTSTGTPVPTPVNGKTVTLYALGAETNLDNLQLIAEASQVEHEDLPTRDKLGWFVTAAYTIGKWKPHLTYQDFSIDDKSQEQSGITLGLNRQLGNSAVLKFEVQQISDIIGNGFFEDPIFDAADVEDGDDVTLYNVALNIVF